MIQNLKEVSLNELYRLRYNEEEYDIIKIISINPQDYLFDGFCVEVHYQDENDDGYIGILTEDDLIDNEMQLENLEAESLSFQI